MKKIFSLLLVLILVSSNFSVAFAEDNVEVKIWEQKLENIKQELKTQDQQRALISPQEKQQQMSKAWDAVYNLNLAKGNIVHIDDIYTEDSQPKYESRSSNKLVVRNGDIILIKPKKWNVWWAPFVGGASHAAMIVDTNKVVEIRDNTSLSEKRSFADFMDYNKGADQIIIINMGLSNEQGQNISQYVSNNLLGKPYPTMLEFHKSKYWMHKFYCSSLVWRAHYSSGKYIDLDDNDKDIIFPVELAFSQYTGKVNIIHQ